MGSFGGLGAEPPTAGGLAGSRGRRPGPGAAGVKGRSPFEFASLTLSLLIADFSFYSRD